jgi:hypothetical protein
MSSRIQQTPNAESPDWPLAASSAGNPSAKFITLQNLGALKSWGIPRKPPQFSGSEVEP